MLSGGAVSKKRGSWEWNGISLTGDGKSVVAVRVWTVGTFRFDPSLFYPSLNCAVECLDLNVKAKNALQRYEHGL